MKKSADAPKKRRTTDDERALFRKVIEQPLKAATPKPSPRKAAAIAAPTGLDGNTAERLKRGARMPQARLDLHGLAQEAAHRALLSFLLRAHGQGLRLVLVVTGKGNPDKGEDAAWMRHGHGVLKEMVPRWLNEKAFAALASGSAPAHRRHGGDGALYVTLKKTREGKNP